MEPYQSVPIANEQELNVLTGRRLFRKEAFHEGYDAIALHDQIQKLEEILRARCPDVNIEEIVNRDNPGTIERPRNDRSQNFPARIAESQAERHSASGTGNVGEGHLFHDRRASSAIPRDTVAPASATPSASRWDDLGTTSTNLPESEIAHEIGLIPLSSGASKYVGPSSGFSFARLVFARAGQINPGIAPSVTNHESSSTTRSRSFFEIRPTDIPSSIDQANQESRIYFEYVHVQYPFLHEPSHYRLISQLYTSYHQVSPSARFQVTMVLAISATILSKRLRIPFTGEGLCATAMEEVNNIDFQNSTEGVQSLLLIVMFTLHSPYLGINPWYLNYQCLAAVLDLGLQRDVPLSRSVSAFEREMRTRIFWVIYSMDRTLATALGRPIGLRDEACDLRLPAGHEDSDTDSESQTAQLPRPFPARPGPISCSMVLFRFAQLNSEIKYILHSITRDVPRYTYPQVPDISAWQTDLHRRLQAIFNEIPAFDSDNHHLLILCQIKYHEIVMLLFRPTPRIRTPWKAALNQCYRSAQAAIQLWKELYDSDRMSYSWVTIHSVCLSAITMLYCIWMVRDTAATTRIDVLTSTMRVASNILSAAGEHWSEARRSRNKMDDLTTATIRWLVDLRYSNQRSQNRGRSHDESPLPTLPNSASINVSEQEQFKEWPDSGFPLIDSYINGEDLAGFVGAPDPFATDVSLTMESMFSEYQPLFDFNPQRDFSPILG
ncbi:hypothetical protein ABEF95_014362 [Exophiala dermatitidis]